MTLARNPVDFLEIGYIEIADAPAEYLALPLQLFKTSNGLGQRIGTPPVEQIAVETVGPQPCQRVLARRDHSGARCVVGEHLGDEKDFIATARDRLADQLLRRSRPIELGAVDMSHPEIEPATERGDRDGGFPLLDVPGALTDDCDFAVG